MWNLQPQVVNYQIFILGHKAKVGDAFSTIAVCTVCITLTGCQFGLSRPRLIVEKGLEAATESRRIKLWCIYCFSFAISGFSRTPHNLNSCNLRDVTADAKKKRYTDDRLNINELP